MTNFSAWKANFGLVSDEQYHWQFIVIAVAQVWKSCTDLAISSRASSSYKLAVPRDSFSGNKHGPCDCIGDYNNAGTAHLSVMDKYYSKYD